MAINIPRGKKDKVIDKITAALKSYEKANPRAQIDLYRQNPVSVRIRIIDPSFHGVDKSSRHERAWHFLEQLPEDVQGDISMLVLLSPEETKTSLSNIEFDDPVPSNL
jgi:hypothetical protein